MTKLRTIKHKQEQQQLAGGFINIATLYKRVRTGLHSIDPLTVRKAPV